MKKIKANFKNFLNQNKENATLYEATLSQCGFDFNYLCEYIYVPKHIGGGGYGYFNGYVAKVLIYDAALSDANIKSISDVLMTKYGL